MLDHLSPNQIASLTECLQWLVGTKSMKEYITPDVAHKTVFSNVPIIGLKNNSLKDHFAQTVLSKIDVKGRYKSCGRGGWMEEETLL